MGRKTNKKGDGSIEIRSILYDLLWQINQWINNFINNQQNKMYNNVYNIQKSSIDRKIFRRRALVFIINYLFSLFSLLFFFNKIQE